MVVIVIGSIIMKKKVEREKKEQEVSHGSEFHDFDNDKNDDKHDMIFGSSGVLPESLFSSIVFTRRFGP